MHFRRTAGPAQPRHPETNSSDLAATAAFFEDLVREAAARGDHRHADAYQDVAAEFLDHASAARAREVRLRDVALGMATRRFFVLR